MWTTRSPGVSRSRMSRGTTRRSARGRRTRTVPNSSRSVTKVSPSGPPVNPPFRLRSTSVDGAGRWRLGDALDDRDGLAGLFEQVREARRLVRGEDDARPVRAPARRRRRPRPAARPNGSVGSRHPKTSPDDSAPRAIAVPTAGSDSQVSSSVREPASRAFQSRGGEVRRRPVLGQLAGPDQLGPPLVGLAPQELGRLGDVARLVEDEQRAGAEVVEAGRRARGGRPRPRRRRRRPWRASRRPARRGRGDRSAEPVVLGALEARQVRVEPLGQPGGRAAQTGADGRRAARAGAGTPTPAGAPRPPPSGRSAGRSGRRRAANRSRRRRTRCGSAAAATAGRRRRCRRASRTRRARRPRATGT